MTASSIITSFIYFKLRPSHPSLFLLAQNFNSKKYCLKYCCTQILQPQIVRGGGGGVPWRQPPRPRAAVDRAGPVDGCSAPPRETPACTRHSTHQTSTILTPSTATPSGLLGSASAAEAGLALNRCLCPKSCWHCKSIVTCECLDYWI